MRAPLIANFDSAAAMVRATAAALRGEPFSLLGVLPKRWTPLLKPLLAGLNRLPQRVRERAYITSGWREALPPERLATVEMERVAEWVVAQYPKRAYPAVMIGSSNGAAVHLCAALGIPWLPQTVLIPVRRSGVPVDEPRAEMAWGQGVARPLLAANPEIELHHMHDPNQDRLMIHKMAYFRVKWRRLPAAYARFLTSRLGRGASLVILNCELSWPVTLAGERHVFQFGAPGGASVEEYRSGGPRVRRYLERYGSPHRSWDPPAADGRRPEAEWGFEPALRADLERLARAQSVSLRELRFRQPQDLSPLVADFYEEAYARKARAHKILLAETFILMEPSWALRAGAVPFWTLFNDSYSARALKDYLRARTPFDVVDILLFSHGTESIGWESSTGWRALPDGRSADLAGADAGIYPRDFAIFARYADALWRRLGPRHSLPPARDLRELEHFLDQNGSRYAVQWETVPAGATRGQAP